MSSDQVSALGGNDAISSYGTSNVSSGSIQFMFALLQMELAQYNKELALDEIKEIKAAQEESKLLTETINKLRNCKQAIGDDDILHIGAVKKYTGCSNEQLEAVKNEEAEGNDTARQEYFEAIQICNNYGVTWKNTKISSSDLDTMIASLESIQEEASSGIQQKMVFIQDYMGQYNSYTQGSSSAISDANETLKTVAQGR